MSGEPKVGHNKFLSDHATGVRVDHSQADGDHFDLSEFDHMLTPEELAEIKRNRADG